MKEAASGATLPVPSTLNNNLTNSDRLVEFFIHPCKFLKYSISFSFNKIKFLLSPKIHDYSLTITRDAPALKVHAKAAPRWLAQRSLSNRPMRAYLLKPPERQVCGFWEVTKPTWQNNRKSNFLTVDTLLTIIGPSDLQVRHRLGPRHVPTDRMSTPLSLHVNYLQLTRTLSAHPQLSFNLCDFTCQHVIAQPIRNHNS